jgi:hypothetical protein
MVWTIDVEQIEQPATAMLFKIRQYVAEIVLILGTRSARFIEELNLRSENRYAGRTDGDQLLDGTMDGLVTTEMPASVVDLVEKEFKLPWPLGAHQYLENGEHKLLSSMPGNPRVVHSFGEWPIGKMSADSLHVRPRHADLDILVRPRDPVQIEIKRPTPRNKPGSRKAVH